MFIILIFHLTSFQWKLRQPVLFTKLDVYLTSTKIVTNGMDSSFSSMPSSLISNNSMVTSQDIGMSQYEMESSGVFSDADAGRKSALLFETRSGTESDHSGLPVALPEVSEDLESVADQLLVNDVFVAQQPGDEPSSEVLEGDLLDDENAADEVEDVNVAVDAKENVAVGVVLRKENSSLSNWDEASPRQARIQKSILNPVVPVQVQRPRSQETKGLATRRTELLQEKPILPNTNVGSKLKEILSRQPATNPGKAGGSSCLMLIDS